MSDRSGAVGGDEREADISVQCGEQVQGCRVLGVENGPQLRFTRLLGIQDPLPVASNRS